MLVELPYVYPCHNKEYCYNIVVVDEENVKDFTQWQREHLPDFNRDNYFYATWRFFILKWYAYLMVAAIAAGVVLGPMLVRAVDLSYK